MNVASKRDESFASCNSIVTFSNGVAVFSSSIIPCNELFCALPLSHRSDNTIMQSFAQMIFIFLKFNNCHTNLNSIEIRFLKIYFTKALSFIKYELCFGINADDETGAVINSKTEKGIPWENTSVSNIHHQIKKLIRHLNNDIFSGE